MKSPQREIVYVSHNTPKQIKVLYWNLSTQTTCFLRNLLKLLRTNSSEKAHDQQDDDTPEHIYIHLSLQFTALVAGTVIVEHGFGLMACEEAQHVSSNWSEVNDGERQPTTRGEPA